MIDLPSGVKWPWYSKTDELVGSNGRSLLPSALAMYRVEAEGAMRFLSHD